MNYTTNYHLPQWVEKDRILMDDFNEAMKKIDEVFSGSLTPDGKAAYCGSFSISGSNVSGDVLATFPFAPKCVIFELKNLSYILGNGGAAYVYFSNYTIRIELKDNLLKLAQMDDDIGSYNPGHLIAFP